MQSRLSSLMAKLRRSLAQVSYLPQTFSLIWSASRYWTIAWLGLLALQGILPAATVYLTRSLVDSLVQVLGAGMTWTSIQPILWPAGLMMVILLLTEFLQGASEWIRTAQSELVQDHISTLIQNQSMAIDFGCYESSDYNDHLSRAKDGASTRALALLEGSGTLLQNSLTLLAIAAVLIPYGVWLPLVLLASALPAFLIVLQINLHQYQWSQRTTTDRRRAQYYDLLLTSMWTAAELRLFNFGPYFQTAYQRLRQRLRREQMQLIRRQSLSRLSAGFLALLITGLALVWMGRQALLGVMTLGDLALFYQAFNRGQGVVKALLNSLGQIYKNSLFTSDLFAFLQLRPQLIDPPHPQPTPTRLHQGIRFRNVTFRYPGSEQAVLDRFNLTIPANKIVAIVGDNGAGKSTLIKLLCRLYDPESGQIEFDGVDIRNFAVLALRNLITVLFQAVFPYYISAAENIAISDLASMPHQAELEAAAQATGIHQRILRLPKGYASILGKWFPEGVELSGGEWQRLALARAFLRKAPIVILDEPTSAMDPWAELDWLDCFRAMAQNHTAIVITHRFTLAMQADLIYVMRDGQVVESGTHEQLLAQAGTYAASWMAQMQAGAEPERPAESIDLRTTEDTQILHNAGRIG